MDGKKTRNSYTTGTRAMRFEKASLYTNFSRECYYFLQNRYVAVRLFGRDSINRQQEVYASIFFDKVEKTFKYGNYFHIYYNV